MADSQTTSNFTVSAVEYAGETVVRNMLVARFVAKGDAESYAIWRRATCLKGWTWNVSEKGKVISIYGPRANNVVDHSMKMTLVYNSATEGGVVPGVIIPKGETVEYLGHVPGGMVSVRWNSAAYTIHPGNIKELMG